MRDSPESILTAVETAQTEGTRLMSMAQSSATVADFVEGIQEHLHCSESAAFTVANLQLWQFTEEDRRSLREELGDDPPDEEMP